VQGISHDFLDVSNINEFIVPVGHCQLSKVYFMYIVLAQIFLQVTSCHLTDAYLIYLTISYD
jgi:hypothetical protein